MNIKPKGHLTIPNEMMEYLLDYFSEYKMTPTLQEIADYFSKKHNMKHSREWARYHLKTLVKDGRVKINRYKTRGIEIVLKTK